MDTEQFKKSFVKNPMGQYNEHFEKAKKTESQEKGHIMGNTHTQKVVYSHPMHPKHKGFTSADHSDAANLHSQLSGYHGEFLAKLPAEHPLRKSVHASKMMHSEAATHHWNMANLTQDKK